MSYLESSLSKKEAGGGGGDSFELSYSCIDMFFFFGETLW